MQIMYAARCACFDLLCAVAKVAQRSTTWGEKRDKVIYRLMCVIYSTLHCGMDYAGDSMSDIAFHLYAGADCAGDSMKKSTAGMVCVSGKPVWGSCVAQGPRVVPGKPVRLRRLQALPLRSTPLLPPHKGRGDAHTSVSYECMIIEICGSPRLEIGKMATKLYEEYRITEVDEFRNHAGHEQVRLLMCRHLHMPIVVWVSCPCTGGSSWEYHNWAHGPRATQTAM